MICANPQVVIDDGEIAEAVEASMQLQANFTLARNKLNLLNALKTV